MLVAYPYCHHDVVPVSVCFDFIYREDFIQYKRDFDFVPFIFFILGIVFWKPYHF